MNIHSDEQGSMRGGCGRALALCLLAALAIAAANQAAALTDTPATCETCHGASGAGQAGTGAPRLAGQSEAYLLRQLRDFASGERPSAVMGPIAAALSEAEQARLAQRFATLAAPAPAASVAASDAARAGAAIASAGLEDRHLQACADCHGSEGRGQGTLFPGIAGLPRDYLEQTLKEYRAGLRRNDPYRLMRHVAEGLRDEDIAAVAAYYAGLAPQAPAPAVAAAPAR